MTGPRRGHVPTGGSTHCLRAGILRPCVEEDPDMGDTVTLALQGEVTLDAFSRAVLHFSRLVDGLSADVAAPETLRWVITELEAGSAIMTARGVGDAAAAASVSTAYIGVGKALERGDPASLPERIRDEARALIAVIDGGVEAVRFETAEADATIRSLEEAFATSGALEAPDPQPVAYGGVTGRVQTLSSRGGLRFTLYDTLFDRAVSCYLDEGQEEIMRDVWGRMAVVEGLVTRDRVTGRPQVIRGVRGVTVVHEAGPDAYLGSRGVLQRDPAGGTPEDAIRELRSA